jgi:hypothetical protein
MECTAMHSNNIGVSAGALPFLYMHSKNILWTPICGVQSLALQKNWSAYMLTTKSWSAGKPWECILLKIIKKWLLLIIISQDYHK